VVSTSLCVYGCWFFPFHSYWLTWDNPTRETNWRRDWKFHLEFWMCI
jgi:hypothetical protein